jgi:hypothetical protein
VNVLLNELTETEGVELELELPPPLAAAEVVLLDLLELPHAATAQQAHIAATMRKSLLLSKFTTSSEVSLLGNRADRDPQTSTDGKGSCVNAPLTSAAGT